MYPCRYPGCGETFASHTALAEHIFRDHAARMFVAIIAALAIALALLRPASAQDAPQPTPAVGGGPQIAVEHKVFLPVIMVPDDVSGQGRYWGGLANPNVSWCPSCRG